MPVSERLQQIFEVLDGVRAAAPDSLAALSNARKRATKAVAVRRDIDERTVADKCWRGLWREKDENFHIADFDALAWAWLNDAPEALRTRCADAATNDDDRTAVAQFFNGDGPVTRYHIHGDCQVWVEPWNAGSSIVVNSVGGGADRRPGMAAVLEALAQAGHGLAEVGYHSSRGAYQALDGVPWPVASTLERPGEAAQALQTAAGKVPGANGGSRLRLVLPDARLEDLDALLRRLAADGPRPAPIGEAVGRETHSGVQIVDHVYRSLAADGLDFSREQVADFYLAVRTKPFVLLAGISGTGKSILARRFATACGFPAPLIAVRPDWSDPSELLGYRDLEGAFVPGRLIPHLVAAAAEPHRPYFVILDEMNLARVEHYFADLLSVMETRQLVGDLVVTDALDLGLKSDTRIRCDKGLADALAHHQATGGLRLPSNLCVIGTVNMDESTHPFSKKVLDRAMTLEFVTVDLRAVPIRHEPPAPLHIAAADLDAPCLSLSQVYGNQEALFQPAIDLLVDLNSALAQASMQVGYRTRDEVCLFLFHNATQQLLSETDALDLAVYHKVLPRLQGGEEVRELLGEVHRLLSSRGLARCVAKLDEMKRRLEQAGFTAFWA
jgi:hypothetical protein